MTRGPDPRFGTTFLAGQGDPTRDITLISRVSRNLTGRVGSGQEVSYHTGRFGSDRVGGFSISRIG